MTLGRQIAYSSANLGTQAVLIATATYLPPLIAHRFAASNVVIGLVTSVPAIAGIVVQPVANVASDRTRSRFGRRLPFIASGASLATAGLFAIGAAPSVASLAALMLAAFVAFNVYVGPYRASLAEEVSSPQRTTVTGIQAFCKGVGTLLAVLGGSLLFKVSPSMPFWLAAVALLATAAIAGSVMSRHNDASASTSVAHTTPIWRQFDVGKHTRVLLAAHFCWWFALHAMSTFTVLYVVHDLRGIHDVGTPEGQAAASEAAPLVAAFALTGMLAAIPVGLLAKRVGKRAVLVGGLMVLASGYAVACRATAPVHVFGLAIAGGVGFACVQVIPFAWLFDLEQGRDGALTACFNLLIDAAQISSLAIVGWLIDRTGSYRVVYEVGLMMIVLAGALVATIRRAGSRDGAG